MRKAVFEQIHPLFESYMREQHIPGLVYGVVADGKLVHVRAMGVQDVKTRAPVTPDTVFRIASMSKNFTALAVLKLRDEGKLSLDAPAERYVPELKALKYPTSDSPRITVRDLLVHTAGFVTDDPWGDRQLAMSEAEFSRFLAAGVPFSRAPGTAWEYSNFGYALLGRIITNLSGRNYADYITESFLKPLGMSSTTYDFTTVPQDRRAIGYRWEDDKWTEEPILGHGTFGAMGGVLTSANDYARFLAWQLAAWPPRDDAEDGILNRASIREIARPQSFMTIIPPAESTGCVRAASYGLGVIPYSDCVIGSYIGHSGGLPGYGSYMVMLPGRGVAVFAMTNRTYAAPSSAVREAASRLIKSGAFPERQTPVSPALQLMAAVVAKIYATGDVLTQREALAMNFLLDRDAAHRNAEINKIRSKLGTCRDHEPIVTDNAMSATIFYPCERGRLQARVLLAPTSPASIQSLTFQIAER
ncbi:MAG TPA: serine hydrolase domain-containing protein [Steroidobacteraceae bacterium]